MITTFAPSLEQLLPVLLYVFSQLVIPLYPTADPPTSLAFHEGMIPTSSPSVPVCWLWHMWSVSTSLYFQLTFLVYVMHLHYNILMAEIVSYQLFLLGFFFFGLPLFGLF